MQICDVCRRQVPDDDVLCRTPGCAGTLIAAGPGAAPNAPGFTGTPAKEGTGRTARSLELVFPDGGDRVLVEPDERIHLGRDPALSALAGRLTDDTVSRRHATIGLGANGDAWIRDEFATNGTFVNGAALESGAERHLKDDDLIRLGEFRFKVRFVRGAAASAAGR
jgi:hypothetical protein